MNWFFVSLAAPFVWSITNHIDKYLIEKYFKRGGIGTLMIFSSVMGALVLPFLFFKNPNIFAISWVQICILVFNGLLAATVLWLYFSALQEDEASIVVIFYQLIPIFGYLLGYFILGEKLTAIQILAMCLIVVGAMVVTVEIDEENKMSLKLRTLFLMSGAGLLTALDSVLFKYVAIKTDIWASLFWEYLSLLIVGLALFSFIKPYRSDFINTLNTNSKKILSLNILNEFLYIGGNLLFAYAYLLAPIALVLLVNSYQPLIVLILGIFLTLFFPNISTEKITLRATSQKIISILVVGVGTYLLFL